MTTSMDEFLQYLGQHESEIIVAQKKLQENVHDDNLEAVRNYAGDILAYRAYLVTCLAKFNELLDKATFEFMPEKTSKTTDFDRRSKIESIVSPIRYWRDVAKGLVDTIDNRVSYAQSELSFEKEYAKRIGGSHA